MMSSDLPSTLCVMRSGPQGGSAAPAQPRSNILRELADEVAFTYRGLMELKGAAIWSRPDLVKYVLRFTDIGPDHWRDFWRAYNADPVKLLAFSATSRPYPPLCPRHPDTSRPSETDDWVPVRRLLAKILAKPDPHILQIPGRTEPPRHLVRPLMADPVFSKAMLGMNEWYNEGAILLLMWTIEGEMRMMGLQDVAVLAQQYPSVPSPFDSGSASVSGFRDSFKNGLKNRGFSLQAGTRSNSRIYTVVHVGRSHWVAVEVNFRKEEVTWHDGLGSYAEQDVYKV
ncbi:hypothetical protein IAU59_007576 [Kwoniella sp. CBS 9459]